MAYNKTNNLWRTEIFQVCHSWPGDFAWSAWMRFWFDAGQKCWNSANHFPAMFFYLEIQRFYWFMWHDLQVYSPSLQIEKFVDLRACLKYPLIHIGPSLRGEKSWFGIRESPGRFPKLRLVAQLSNTIISQEKIHLLHSYITLLHHVLMNM